MLLVRVLLGRPKLLSAGRSGNLMGAQCTTGFTSHIFDPSHSECVLFDSAAMLPCYILHFGGSAHPSAGMMGVGEYSDEPEDLGIASYGLVDEDSLAGYSWGGGGNVLGGGGCGKSRLVSGAMSPPPHAAKRSRREREDADLAHALKQSLEGPAMAAQEAADIAAAIKRSLEEARR